MNDLKELAVSSGSACTSAKKKPSHVLMSLGLDEATALSSIRFGLGRFNTEEEVDYAINSVISTINKLREVSAA
jgi:cysteine desulfurase